MNYNAIVQFNNKNEVRIDGLYAHIVQITAERGEQVETLAMYVDEPEEHYLYFGDEVLIARFKDYSLYLTRSSNDIDVIELAVMPNILFDKNTFPYHIEIIDNEIMLMSLNGAGNKISRTDLSNLVSRINAEANRRSNSASVGTVGTQRASAAAVGAKIIASNDTTAGSFANVSYVLRRIKGNAAIPIPSAGSKLISTGASSYQYLSELTDALATISVTSANTGCAASCTGLCSTGCYSGCSSCTGTCSGTCSGSCSGSCRNTCSGSCDGSWGCGGDCTYEPGIGECC